MHTGKRWFGSAAILVVAAMSAVMAVQSPTAAVGTSVKAAPAATGSVSKTITVDGQEVEVVLAVTRFDAAASPQANPKTAVTLTLRTNDGNDLPEVTAKVIKLERVRPPLRIFREELTQVVNIRFDPTSTTYGALGDPAFRVGVRLKATIRLETADGVRYVRFSEVRVGQ